MKQTILAFTCATLLVGASTAQAQDQAYTNFPGNEVTAGDEGGYVGDEDDFVGDYGDVSVPVVQTGSFVGDLDTVGDMEVGDDSGVLASAVPQVEPMAPQPLANSYVADNYSYETAATGSMYRAFCKPAPMKWLRAESLLWFLDERDTPPLVQVGPTANTATDAYGNPITSGLAPGFRFDYGHYFNDNIGVGARVWGLFGEDESKAFNAAPGTAIVRPFFNTTRLGGPDFDQLIVSGVGGATGSFTVESEFDLLAVEAYGRLKFGETKDYRIDLIGGYSHFSIDDSLLLVQDTTLIPDRTIFRDYYDTENRFYGGQLGMETVINKGRWSFTSLSKVHLGNMNQRVLINGVTLSGVVPANPAVVAANNGFFVQGQGGTYEKDEFTFVPEMNLRLGYSPRSQVHLTLGYTFAYWSSVALAGDQINPVVDGVNALTFADVPGAQSARYGIISDGFWLQGIDLGVTFNF